MIGRSRFLGCIVAILVGASCAKAADGGQPWDLPTACLIAGGLSDNTELAIARERLVDLCRSIATPSLVALPVHDRARVLFQRLHARVLTGSYDRQATNWRITLEQGD